MALGWPRTSARTALTSAVGVVFTSLLLRLLTPRASGICLPLANLSVLNEL